MDNDLPRWAQEILSLGPKHPVRDKIKEILFLALVDTFLIQLKNWKVTGQSLCEIEASAKAYEKRVKQTLSDRGLEKALKNFKNHDLFPCHLIKMVLFCIMKKDLYEAKFLERLQLDQIK